MQAMMCEDTRCIALAAFGSEGDLQDYMDSLSRGEKKIKANSAEVRTGMTPLLAACRRDAVKHVEILLTFGADVNQANLAGWTPMMAASRNASSGTRDVSSSSKILEMLHDADEKR